MSTNQETTYIAVAERLLGYVLNHPDAVPELYDRLPDSLLFPQKFALASAWQSVLQQSADGVAMSPETVSDASGASVEALTGYLLSEARTTPADVEELVEILVRRGKESARRRVGRLLHDGKLDGVGAIGELDRLETYGLRHRDTSAAALIEQFDNDVAKPPAKANPTGIGPLDVALWEMPVGKTTIAAAEYKGWKTRAMRNMVLAASARGARSFVVLAEGWVDEFTRECLAIIANQFLMRSGKWNDNRNNPKLTGEYLARSRKWQSNPVHAEAIGVARWVYRHLPLRVWDSRDGANSPQAILAEARKEVRLGTSLLALDYIQNVDFDGKELYNQMVTARKWLRTLKSIDNGDGEPALHILLMSQKNEESIKSQGKNSGLKGGGELAQETDALLAPNHDDDEDALKFPDEAWRGILKLPLRFSRVNRAMKLEFEVELNSGAILSYTHTAASGTQTVVPVDIIPLTLLMPQQPLIPEKDDLI